LKIKLESISMFYRRNSDKKINILKNIDYTFRSGKFYAIMGKSGSGKSTLLNLLGILDCPTEGTIYYDEIDTRHLTEKQILDFRSKKIGFIFQDYYLNNYLNIFENVELPLLVGNYSKKTRGEKVSTLLEKVDLLDRAKHFPKQISGGEKQRTAIARALANDPIVILADEPTGNLDPENEQNIFNILKDLSKQGKCVIVVSHNNTIKDYADIVLHLDNGQLKEEQNEK